MSKYKLLTDKHPQQDFFVADIFGSLPVKDDIASMEHPMFTLATKKDLRVINYEHNGNKINITPNVEHGLPTIFDKDILLYCASLLVNECNKGNVPSRVLRISTHDLLVATNRPGGGRGYELIRKALDRLTSVYIDTNIKTDGKEITSGFHLIEKYDIVESSRVKDRMVKLEITLSEWLYNSIIGKEVLTINRDYFRLRQALERRIYEIARKHCGLQEKFKMNLQLLYKKVGSSGTINKFKYNLKKIIEKNVFPDYEIKLEEDDVVVFIKTSDEIEGDDNQASEEPIKKVENIEVIKNNNKPSLFIGGETLTKAREIALNARSSYGYSDAWCVYALQDQFKELNKDKMDIINPEALFLGFIRHKVKKPPVGWG